MKNTQHQYGRLKRHGTRGIGSERFYFEVDGVMGRLFKRHLVSVMIRRNTMHYTYMLGAEHPVAIDFIVYQWKNNTERVSDVKIESLYTEATWVYLYTYWYPRTASNVLPKGMDSLLYIARCMLQDAQQNR